MKCSLKSVSLDCERGFEPWEVEMSFKCEFCKKLTEPGEKKTMRPVELREKTYPTTYRRNGEREVAHSGGQGFEIVREQASCAACLKIPVVPKIHRLGEPPSAPLGAAA